MPFRYRRSIRLARGLHINLSKSGASLSVGRRGATVNIGRRGTRATVGLPGTGMSWSERLKPGQPAMGGAANGVLGLLLIVALAVLIALIV